MDRRRRRCPDPDEVGLQRQIFLGINANPFMNEVYAEFVDQRDIGDRGIRLRALCNDMGLEGL